MACAVESRLKWFVYKGKYTQQSQRNRSFRCLNVVKKCGLTCFEFSRICLRAISRSSRWRSTSNGFTIESDGFVRFSGTKSSCWRIAHMQSNVCCLENAQRTKWIERTKLAWQKKRKQQQKISLTISRIPAQNILEINENQVWKRHNSLLFARSDVIWWIPFERHSVSARTGNNGIFACGFIGWNRSHSIKM